MYFTLSKKEVKKIKTSVLKKKVGTRKEGALMVKAKRSRSISLLIIVAMLVSMLPLGAMTAFAGTTATASTVPNILIGGSGRAGSINIKEASGRDLQEGAKVIKLTLPQGVTFNDTPTVATDESSTGLNVSLDTSSPITDSIYISVVASSTTGKAGTINISNIAYAVSSTVAEGDIIVTMEGDDTKGASNGEVVNAKAAKAGTTSKVTDSKTPEVQSGINNQKAAEIKITEVVAGSLMSNADPTKNTITITAPSGTSFASVASPAATVTGNLHLVSNTPHYTNNNTVATWEVTATSSGSPASIAWRPYLNVESDVADGTDLTAKIGGKNQGINTNDLVIAKVVKADVTVKADTTLPWVTIGLTKGDGEEVSKFTIEENVAGALAAGNRTLTLTAPEGVKFIEDDEPEASASGVTLTDGTAVLSKSNTVASWTVATGTSGTTKGKITVDAFVVYTDETVKPGAVTYKLGGSSMPSTIDIALATSRLITTNKASSKPDAVIGIQDQPVGDIVIEENFTGSIAKDTGGTTEDTLELVFPAGVTIDAKPTIKVTGGNLDVKLSGNPIGGRIIDLLVNSTGTNAKSTITISGLRVTLSQSVPFGDLKVTPMGIGDLLDGPFDATDAIAVAFAKTQAIAPPAVSSKFSDVPTTHWALTYINTLADKNIINGYNDGTFRPSGDITRAEFAKVVVLAAGLTVSTETTAAFSDVSTSDWSYPYIITAKKAGIIGGYEDGTFRPSAKVTRAEIGKMVVLAGNFTINTTGVSFSDVDTSHWAFDYIMTAKNLTIVNGYPDGTFGPSNNATRAEAAKMVTVMMEQIAKNLQ